MSVPTTRLEKTAGHPPAEVRTLADLAAQRAISADEVVASNTLEARVHFQHTGKAHRRPNTAAAYAERARLGFDTASKGHIDPGETTVVAARREIYEESGIRDLKFIRELGTYERYKIGVDGGDDRSERKEITMFLFRTSEKLLRPVDPDNPEARWVERSKVTPLLTHEGDKEFFRGVEF